MLPKIHKERTTWPFPDVPPGRPIVSDCGSESYGVAELITSYLNPLSTRHTSYIRDTYQFLKKVQGMKISPNARLFSMDVESLYTNIDSERGLEAVKRCIQRYPVEGRPEESLLRLLELSLTRNDFEFNGRYFLQVKRTAMGKKFVPAHANIYMAEWEQLVFPKCKFLPIQSCRYWDDVWGVWEGTEEDWLEFVHTLNQHHPSIWVKYELRPDMIDFLDTTLYKGPGFLDIGADITILMYSKGLLRLCF